MKIFFTNMVFLMFLSVTTVSLSMPTLETHSVKARGSDLSQHSGRAPPLGPLVDLIGSAVESIIEGIAADNDDRSEWTRDVIGQLNEISNAFNYVVCHPKHAYYFEGERGTDWGSTHKEFDIRIGGTIGYDIYWFGSGIFMLLGDGGYINWAYSGRIISDVSSDDERTIIFGERPDLQE